MSLPRSVAEVLKSHVTLEVEGIDRMYLNVYQPRLQTDRGVVSFFRFHRGEIFASSALMNPMSKSFITAVDRFVSREQIPLITFTKGQRKDEWSRSTCHGGLGRCWCSPLARSFVCGCRIISTMLRFHSPLIEPDGPNYGIRLSDKISYFRPRKSLRNAAQAD